MQLILTYRKCFFVSLVLIQYGHIRVHLSLHCNIRQLVCHSNFLIKRFPGSEDYSALDRGKFDMNILSVFIAIFSVVCSHQFKERSEESCVE